MSKNIRTSKVHGKFSSEATFSGAWKFLLPLALCLIATAGHGYAEDTGNNLPAEFTITKDVLVPSEKIEPIGVNRDGDPGGCQFSENTFIKNPGNEPFHWRYMARIININDDGSVQIDSEMTNWNGALKSGFYSGADVRVYRIVGKDGNKLPKKPHRKSKDKRTPFFKGCFYMDPTNADHVKFIGKTKVISKGVAGYPDGGWITGTKINKETINKKTGKKSIVLKQDWDKSKIYFTDKVDFHYGDYLFFDKQSFAIDMDTVRMEDQKTGGRAKISWHWAPKNCELSLDRHIKDLPKEMFDPGEGCLKIEVKAGAGSIDQKYMIGGGSFYGDFEEGKKYRMEVWMRQKGLEGTVNFSFTKDIGANEKFNVTDKWQKFTCDFIGKKNKGGMIGPKFSFTGPGTLWFDNSRIFKYKSDADLDKPHIPGDFTLQELIDSQPASGRKGAIRLWTGLNQNTMERLCSLYGNTRPAINWNRCLIKENSPIVKGLMYAETTGDSPETRMVPWQIIQVTFTEDDYRNLIEYLAAPYDPKKDTPKSKPFAYKRYQQRGHGRPWTDTFREIMFEFGNENWHNRYPLFPSWIGFGEYCGIHQGGKEFGIFTRYYIEEIMKSPYWKSENLDKKIKFCLGGNYSAKIDEKTGEIKGYGQEATQANGLNTYEGHANYMGPLWELGQELKQTLCDESFQNTMLSYQSKKHKYDAMGATLKKLHEMGFTKVSNVAYEGGPSGFSISGKGLTKADLEAIQQIGHSKAIGLSSLQAWLGCYQMGFTYQCYYFYGQGGGWNSHCYIKNGFLPSPGFMTLEMANRNLIGDMLTVKTDSTPTISMGKMGHMSKAKKSKEGKKGGKSKKSVKKVKKTTEYPLVDCFAFRDGNRYSVAVISLKLDGKHSGQDFGDGYSPVTLKLPFTSAKKITVQKLVGDPRESNRFEEKITVESETVPAGAIKGGVFKIDECTGGGKNGIPPGTVFMYVFEDVE